MDSDVIEELESQNIRTLPRHLLFWLYNKVVPLERRLPDEFWMQYDEKKQMIGLRASLLLWSHSEYQYLPRKFQLIATMAVMTGQDSLIDVGTGAGKTLCMVLPCMLAPETMAIVFSPLKRLQVVQVLEFSRYHIKAIAINEDTPNNLELWEVCTSAWPVLDAGNPLDPSGHQKR